MPTASFPRQDLGVLYLNMEKRLFAEENIFKKCVNFVKMLSYSADCF